MTDQSDRAVAAAQRILVDMFTQLDNAELDACHACSATLTIVSTALSVLRHSGWLGHKTDDSMFCQLRAMYDLVLREKGAS